MYVYTNPNTNQNEIDRASQDAICEEQRTHILDLDFWEWYTAFIFCSVYYSPIITLSDTDTLSENMLAIIALASRYMGAEHFRGTRSWGVADPSDTRPMFTAQHPLSVQYAGGVDLTLDEIYSFHNVIFYRHNMIAGEVINNASPVWPWAWYSPYNVGIWSRPTEAAISEGLMIRHAPITNEGINFIVYNTVWDRRGFTWVFRRTKCGDYEHVLMLNNLYHITEYRGVFYLVAPLGDRFTAHRRLSILYIRGNIMERYLMYVW